MTEVSPASDVESLMTGILACWLEIEADKKAQQTLALRTALDQTDFASLSIAPLSKLDVPGAPARPTLVEPRDLPRRGLASSGGHAAFIHAICHIEFSAINLALDAVLRFRAMPADYYRDWLAVAVDEAQHFSWLSAHLQRLGYRYGDFPAHQGLWAMAERTKGSLLARMALVPRVLEARGLDVTPAMIKRLNECGDEAGAAILTRILADEIKHVAVGSRWFSYAAELAGVNPEAVFTELVEREIGQRSANKLNLEARRQAGFTQHELDWLSGKV